MRPAFGALDRGPGPSLATRSRHAAGAERRILALRDSLAARTPESLGRKPTVESDRRQVDRTLSAQLLRNLFPVEIYAEDRPEGAHCSHCHFSADRNHAAAQRICARGLSSQPAVHQDRRTGHLAILQAQDSQVARCRRRRPRLGPTSKPPTHPVPWRRRVLSPPAAAAVNGQRPEGGAPQVGARSASGQDTSAQPCSASPGHRPRWVSLGRGFHRNAHATAAVPRGDFGPRALGYAPLRVA